MNNPETTQQRIEREKRQGALNMPSLTRDAIDPTQADDITQHFNEQDRFPALVGGYKQDPYLTGGYVDDWEQPVQEISEEDGRPSLPTLRDPRRLS